VEAAPERKEVGPRERPVLERIGHRVQELLSDRRLSSGKQRWTAPVVQEILLSEGLEASERTIRRCMAEWKRSRAEVFVPLVYRPGEMAEVDFFEVVVGPPEARRKAHLFLMREMYGPEDFACLYDRQDQVCFLDGHVRAFEHFGGVPLLHAFNEIALGHTLATLRVRFAPGGVGAPLDSTTQDFPSLAGLNVVLACRPSGPVSLTL
jgi:transposase